MRLVNNTGSTITSVYVDYFGEQWSIAENQTNINTITFSYQTGATVTSLTSGSWTNVTALNFTQIYTSSQSSSMGGSACGGSSAQCLGLNGNQNSNRVHIQGCITVSIPVGQEIMFRWTDINDAANDHHMQIDDLSIWPLDELCTVVLPVELVSFDIEKNKNSAQLIWTTASETNNDYFAVERSENGNAFEEIGSIDGAGNSNQILNYSYTDEHCSPGNTYYYRLKQTDFNGNTSYSAIRSVTFEDSVVLPAVYFDGVHIVCDHSFSGKSAELKLFNVSGQMLEEITVQPNTLSTFQSQLPNGVYLIWMNDGTRQKTVKLFVGDQFREQ
ncbi:MAG: hypothetical protein Fur0041_08590 [Bacteroidia bacterium]